MKCLIKFQVLPEEAIGKFENPSKRERGYLKISKDEFFWTEEDLRIRPRAVAFAKKRKSDYPTFAVIYSNGKVTDCLFVFKLIKYADSEDYGIEMTRCIGKRATRKRKNLVRDLIYEDMESLKKFNKYAQKVIFIKE